MLRERTAATTAYAETSTFMSALMDGRLPLAGYTDMLAQHAYAYEVLESPAPAVADDPTLQPFLHPGLLRTEALAADLETLVGPDWRQRHEPTPATERYVARLREARLDVDRRLRGPPLHPLPRRPLRRSVHRAHRHAHLRPHARAWRPVRCRSTSSATSPRSRTATGPRSTPLPWDGDEQVRIVDEIRAAYACQRRRVRRPGAPHHPVSR
ncbi:MAG: biliverdin-producing heme oxygenase [Microthrixaceae bacterium]